MSTLNVNISRVINDLDDIRAAIEDKGVEVPDSTSTDAYAQKIREIKIGIFPEGKIAIAENASSIDISEHATAEVNVPQGIFPEGTLEITENGSYDVSEYQSVYANTMTVDKYLEGTIINYTGYAKSVMYSAFSGNSVIQSIDLPDATSVDRYGFANCVNLQSARLESCTSLSTEVFYSCNNLESVYRV